jgi:hypothetical protein
MSVTTRFPKFINTLALSEKEKAPGSARGSPDA